MTDPELTFHQRRPELLVIDNFYKDPDAVRQLALSQTFVAEPSYHKGKRSSSHLFPYVREEFSRLLQTQIINWTQYGTNGVFQYCHAEDPLVIHSDAQTYAGAVYLTPNAPVESGTWFYRSKATGLRAAPTQADATRLKIEVGTLEQMTYKDKLYDQTAWELTDKIANVYNRLVLWNAKLIHSAGLYFGPDDPEKSRLFQLFFFDVDSQ